MSAKQVVTLRVLVDDCSREQPERGVLVMSRLLDLARDMPAAQSASAVLDDLSDSDRVEFAAFL